MYDSFNEEKKKKKGKQNHGIQMKYEMAAKVQKRDSRGNRSNLCFQNVYFVPSVLNILPYLSSQ